MFAQRADEVIRELVTFVDVAAYFADEAFFAIGFWLRFYIFLIVGVSHGVKIVHDAGFGDAADEHSMGTKVYILFNLQRHKCINIFVQEYQSVIGTVDLLTCKFIYAASGLETKLLEYRERCIYRQAVYIENSSLFDHMVGVICLIDIYRNTVWSISELGHSVDDQSVVFFAVIGGNYIKTVSDSEKGCHVIFVCQLIILGNVFFAELACHSFQLILVFLVYCGKHFYSSVQPVDLLAARKHFFHNFCCQRCPGTIFDDAHGAVLEVVLGQTGDIVVHERINACIIGCGSKNQLTVAECVGQSL